jgi:peptidoglycan/LPS O-acetylase OafA/YrhL
LGVWQVLATVSQTEMTTPTPHSSYPKYRPDIDGLRAVAVLSVVAFHAFPASMKGGFIGVDVFFVISGFLISTIIFENLDRGTFSFAEFYARRIKRIFPALIVVLTACLVFGWLSLLPEELNQLGKHVVAGAGFVSNLVLWSESGYFDNSAENKPLLHLWSLGIEEQFYIIWPFLLWAAWKRGLNVLVVTFFLLIASFTLNIWLIHATPVATFYSPLTRFWELLCGSLLALYAINRGNSSKFNSYFSSSKKISTPKIKLRIVNQFISQSVFSCVGLGLLILGFFLINKNFEFPGYWALLPVLGSVMIIMSGPTAWLNRKFFSNKILVWFGLISFPLYLWHWPLLSFGRILYFDAPPLGYRVIAVLLSVLLAWLTMKFVERPLRYGSDKSPLEIFSLSSLLLVPAFIGAVFFNSNFQESHTFEKLSVKRKGEHAIGSSLAWYTGKDDWLFLGNSYDNTVAKLKLATRPDDVNLNEVKETFSRVSEAGASFGIKTVLILGPNKSSIYPEYLPDEIVPSSQRYSSFFLDKFKEIPSLTVYDPTSDLISAKNKEGFLYWRTDTHWNNKGAYIAFAGFSRLMNLQPPNVIFKQGATYSGDLIGISKLSNFPLNPLDNWDVIWDEPPVWTEKAIPNEQKTTFGDSTLVTNDKAPSKQYVWVVGDSFVGSLRQYFNASFHNVRYVGHWGKMLKILPEEIFKAERKPDLIVIVRVERSF